MIVDDAWRAGAQGRESRQVHWFIHTTGDLASVRTADQVGAAGDGINLIAVILAILLVLRMTRRTVERVTR